MSLSQSAVPFWGYDSRKKKVNTTKPLLMKQMLLSVSISSIRYSWWLTVSRVKSLSGAKVLERSATSLHSAHGPVMRWDPNVRDASRRFRLVFIIFLFCFYFLRIVFRSFSPAPAIPNTSKVLPNLGWTLFPLLAYNSLYSINPVLFLHYSRITMII